MAVTGHIHSLESFGTLDGPGIRFVVFLQGCLLRCKYCHNPDTWQPGTGMTMTADKLMQRIERCRNFIRSGGVTLSGGEPLLQPEFSLELLQLCHERGFHTALDTSGAIPLEKSRTVIDAADMVLLDIKALDPELCRELTGQDNTNALDTLNYCEENGKEVWIRHVLVPGWTLEEKRLRELARYLQKFRCISRIELLPFHKMAAFKWRALEKDDPFANVRELSAQEYQQAKDIFSQKD